MSIICEEYRIYKNKLKQYKYNLDNSELSKKEIENIYTQIRRNKEKENGIENISTTVSHKKVARPLTPDGRT